jgi:hypothetical protein
MIIPLIIPRIVGIQPPRTGVTVKCMGMKDVVAAFDQASQDAETLPDWRVRLRIWRLSRRVQRRRAQIDLAKLKALQSVLIRRDRSREQSTGPGATT